MELEDLIKAIVRAELAEMRVSVPGIVESFDSKNMTVTVQPAINSRIMGENKKMPLLVDVPVAVPSSGGFHITFPISKGDECIVIFSDSTIDGWAVNGGTANQTEVRNHHLSDGMAIIGLNSRPRTISAKAGVEYNNSSMELRSDDGKTRITVNSYSVDITSVNGVNVNNCDVTVTGGDVTADGISLKNHIHDGDSGGVTSPPKI